MVAAPVLSSPAATSGRSRRMPRTTVAVTLLTAAIVGGLQVPGAGAAAAAPTVTGAPAGIAPANIRSGPGLGYPVIRTAQAGTALTADCYALGDGRRWFALSTGGYISERVVDSAAAAWLPTCVAPLPATEAPVAAAPPPAAQAGSGAEQESEPGALQNSQTAVTVVGQLVPRAARLKEISFERWGCATDHPAPCVSVVGGWRAAGSVPGSDHPKGKAIDVMVTTNGQDAAGAQQRLGDDIATYMTRNATTLGVKYVIWDNLIWTPRSGWQTYCRSTCPQGSVNPTYLHQDHVHISVQ